MISRAVSVTETADLNFGLQDRPVKERRAGGAAQRTTGGPSGMLFPSLIGVFVDYISYKPVFLLAAIMPLLGTIALFAAGRAYRLESRLAMPATTQSYKGPHDR
jgi:hypothetical protein